MPKGKGSLPPQHGLELLTVYAWEQAGCDHQFNMAQGFRTVLELVGRYRELCVYWTVNYDNRDKTVGDFLSLQLQKPRSWPTLRVAGSQTPSLPPPHPRSSHFRGAWSRESKLPFLEPSSCKQGRP